MPGPEVQEPRRRVTGVLWSALILVLPFFYLQWITPFLSDLRIAMDYPRISCPQQQELLFSIWNGSFPLYVPGFAGGQSSAALTAGQLFHPLSYLAGLAPGYWGGLAQDWNTTLRLLSLGVAHLLLFRLLRRLGLQDLMALALSSVTVFNLRMLNIFHGGAALEAYSGYLFTSVAILWCWLEPKRWWPRVGVIASTYWMVTSGHPQFAYYAGLGTVLVTLLAPGFLRAMTGRAKGERGDDLRFWVRIGVLGGAGALLTAAYLLPFQLDFMSGSMRVGREYHWSLWWGDTFPGTLNNFFQPLYSAASAAFGGSALPLVAALVPLLVLFRVRVPRFVWGSWAVLLVVFLHMQGDRTPVHHLLWKLVPMFGSIRGPGRITLILPVPILFILAWLVRAGPVVWKAGGRERKVAPLTIVALLALVASAAYRLVPVEWAHDTMRNAPDVFHRLGDGVHDRIFLLGLVALVALATVGVAGRTRWAALAGLVLFLAVSVQTRSSLRYGAWSELRLPSPTLAEMSAQKRSELDFGGNPGGGLYSAVVLRQLEASCLDPGTARFYRDYVIAADEDDAYALMDRGRDPGVAVVTGAAPETTGLPRADGVDERVELLYSSFNRLTFDVGSPEHGFFVLNFPWSPGWSARVDGQEAEIRRANGAYQAVLLPAGRRRVDFVYSSAASVLGMLVSCLTFAVVGVVIVSRARSGPTRLAGLAVVGMLAVGAFAGWFHSLYRGKNLETDYVWTPAEPSERSNLAFGRPTAMSPIYPNRWNEHQELGRVPARWGSGRGVDGARAPGAGFRSATVRDPEWTVDLGAVRQIDEIVLYGADQGTQPDGAEFLLEAFDGSDWVELARTSDFATSVARFSFEPAPASAVRIRATGTSLLAIDEVEVFGPAR